MRKKKPAEHANHERWLVSYADFITLLFAFFVVMFATAQQDKSKAKVVAEAIRDAMEHGQLSNVWTNMTKPKQKTDKKTDSPEPPEGSNPSVAAEKKNPPKKPALATQADLAKSMEALNKGLATELKTGKVTVNLNQRGLIVSLREAAFFASGDDTVSAMSYPIVEKIAHVIGPLANPLRLEGHTDAIPIHNSRFRNNWELSTARSIAMLELLGQKYQYPNERLSVAGYAENSPVDTNDTEEGRAHNRRVDLVVLSAEAMHGEPATATPATAMPAAAPASPKATTAAPPAVPPVNAKVPAASTSTIPSPSGKTPAPSIAAAAPTNLKAPTVANPAVPSASGKAPAASTSTIPSPSGKTPAPAIAAAAPTNLKAPTVANPAVLSASGKAPAASASAVPPANGKTPAPAAATPAIPTANPKAPSAVTPKIPAPNGKTPAGASPVVPPANGKAPAPPVNAPASKK